MAMPTRTSYVIAVETPEATSSSSTALPIGPQISSGSVIARHRGHAATWSGASRRRRPPSRRHRDQIWRRLRS